jgi:hypothetical protein
MNDNETIIKKVKEIVHQYDPDADIIFFGSRAAQKNLLLRQKNSKPLNK